MSPVKREARATIVIFGAAVRPGGAPSMTLRRRVQAAAVFGRRLDDPLYVPTGGVGRHGPAEAVVMAELLRELGVPDRQIVLEATGRNTLSSARAVARLLRARGAAGPVYAASSTYHLLRCVLLLRLAGIPARPGRPPPFPAARDLRVRWYWRLRELAALPIDLVLMLALRFTGRV